jgi:hypothetical protein
MGKRPKRSCNENQPSTAPGTLTGRGPVAGMLVRPRRSNSASSRDSGLRPEALSP